MCTLTWFRHEAGYELFFNRDEQHTRAEALGLQRGDRSGIRHLAPIDGDAGGTWIGVNEFGLCIALLNRYPGDVRPPEDPPDRRSRGLVVFDVLGVPTIDSVVQTLRKAELERTQPFTLIALAPERHPLRCAWDTEELAIDQLDDEDLPITSAPVALARRARSAAYDRLRIGDLGPGVLERYHASHEPAAGPLSVCMHGEHSSSRSLAHVRVTADRVLFRYRDRAPCEGGPDEVLELELAGRE